MTISARATPRDIRRDQSVIRAGLLDVIDQNRNVIRTLPAELGPLLSLAVRERCPHRQEDRCSYGTGQPSPYTWAPTCR